MSILNFVPKGYTLRPLQKDVLQKVEKHYFTHEVIVLECDVGSGKSLIAKTIANWLQHQKTSTAIVTPRIDLMDQYENTFPDTPVLKGSDRYSCNELETSCGSVLERCENCVYEKAKHIADDSWQTIYNIQTYNYSRIRAARVRSLAPKVNVSKFFKDVVIIDEAHMASRVLFDSYTIKLNSGKENRFPPKYKTIDHVVVWLEKEIQILKHTIDSMLDREHPDEDEIKYLRNRKEKYTNIVEGVRRSPKGFNFHYSTKKEGKKTVKIIQITPTTLEYVKPKLWGRQTQCVILMSATFKPMDLKYLGLGGRKQFWINGGHSIPPDRRPIDVSKSVNMSLAYQEQNMDTLVNLIKEKAALHKGKGLIHCTYSISDKLKKKLRSKRYIFHSSSTREEALREFRTSSDKILVACGMSEGLDLYGKDYEWQGIVKIQYPNLGEPLYRYWSNNDPERYNWMTATWLQQACGRICRSSEDYGITYIFDSSFGNIVKGKYGFYQRAKHLLTDHFKKRIKWT